MRPKERKKTRKERKIERERDARESFALESVRKRQSLSVTLSPLADRCDAVLIKVFYCVRRAPHTECIYCERKNAPSLPSEQATNFPARCSGC